MIRPLRITDVPRQLLPGRLVGADLVCTQATAGSPPRTLRLADLSRWSVKGSHALAMASGVRLDAVAALRHRRGPRAWEVAHLFASHRGLEAMAVMLDGCARHAMEQGGERLFLRAPIDTPATGALRRAGFTLAYREEFFLLPRAMAAPLSVPAIELRPVQPADAYGLFRLYNAAVPGSARAAMGLTFEQWADAREDASGKTREYVWERDGAIQGRILLAQRRDAVVVDALVHPDATDDVAHAIAGAARLAWGHRSAIWIVPAYQPALGRALSEQGWQSLNTYEMLVRPLAAAVREPAMMPAQA